MSGSALTECYFARCQRNRALKSYIWELSYDNNIKLIQRIAEVVLIIVIIDTTNSYADAITKPIFRYYVAD